MQVCQIMSTDIQYVTPGSTVQTAAAKMRAFDVGVLPVCQGALLVGILTDRDITVRVAAAGLPPNIVTVDEAMTGNPTACRETDEVSDAARLMEELQVRRLPVTDGNDQLVGIISLADIAERTGDERLMAQVLEQVCEPGRVPSFP
jgi:CBS domain-containing protein